MPVAIPQPLRKAVYPVANAALRLHGRTRSRSYPIENTIVVASTGRGGSTWLAEIVNTLPGYHMLWEPLHLKNNPVCQRYGFTWQNYIRPDEEAPVKSRYVRSLLTGAELTTGTLSSLSLQPSRLLWPRGYTVKFVNANMMLGWMLRRFPVRAVLMVRHPCAVVASQLAHGGWKGLTKDVLTIPAGLLDDYPHLRDVFEDIERPEEVLAFEWSVATLVPLRHPAPHPWLLTTYEWLVEDGHNEVDRLFGHLGEPVPAAAYDHLRKASATVSDESNLAVGRDVLTGWRHRLSPSQVDNVVRVAHDAGVTVYDRAARPHLDRA